MFVLAAIHSAAGSELYQACKAAPEVKPGIRCPTGEARVTRKIFSQQLIDLTGIEKHADK